MEIPRHIRAPFPNKTKARGIAHPFFRFLFSNCAAVVEHTFGRAQATADIKVHDIGKMLHVGTIVCRVSIHKRLPSEPYYLFVISLISTCPRRPHGSQAPY